MLFTILFISAIATVVLGFIAKDLFEEHGMTFTAVLDMNKSDRDRWLLNTFKTISTGQLILFIIVLVISLPFMAICTIIQKVGVLVNGRDD